MIEANLNQGFLDKGQATSGFPAEDYSETGAVFLQTYRQPVVGESLYLLGENHLASLYHTADVRARAQELGQRMLDNPDHLKILDMSAALHDVAKSKIPVEILDKPGKLTGAELVVMTLHDRLGAQMYLETAEQAHPVVASLIAKHHSDQPPKPAFSPQDVQEAYDILDMGPAEQDRLAQADRQIQAFLSTMSPDLHRLFKRLLPILGAVDQFSARTDENRPYRQPSSPEQAHADLLATFVPYGESSSFTKLRVVQELGRLYNVEPQRTDIPDLLAA